MTLIDLHMKRWTPVCHGSGWLTFRDGSRIILDHEPVLDKDCDTFKRKLANTYWYIPFPSHDPDDVGDQGYADEGHPYSGMGKVKR